MEIYEDVLKKFMAKFPRFEPKIMDHSAMIAFKACPRKYFYRYVLGRAPKDTPIYFAFGSAYHKFREVLELRYLELIKESKTPNIYNREAALVACQDGINAAMKSWGNTHNPPLGSRFDFMTQERLLKSCLVAFNHWEAEKKVGAIRVIATEQAFNVQLADGTQISGRADQIVKWNGKLWGRDFKTSSKDQKFYGRSIDPNNQFSLYTFAEGLLAGEQIYGQIIEVLFNDRKNGPTVHTHIASRNKYQIDRWIAETLFWDRLMKAARDEDMYPMAEVSCSFCDYHSVCKSPTESSMMFKLESEYKVSPWDNTKVDQD